MNRHGVHANVTFLSPSHFCSVDDNCSWQRSEHVSQCSPVLSVLLSTCWLRSSNRLVLLTMLSTQLFTEHEIKSYGQCLHKTHCNYINQYYQFRVPSVPWRCWLGVRKGIQPVKNWVVGCWCGYLSEVRCIWPSRCYSHSLSLAPVNPDWFYLPAFTFLVLAHPGSPEQNPEEP